LQLKTEKENAMTNRRDFLKKTGYAAPAILTLSAQPSFAKGGSGRHITKRLRNRNGGILKGKLGRPHIHSHGCGHNEE